MPPNGSPKGPNPGTGLVPNEESSMLKLTRGEMIDLLGAVIARQDELNRLYPAQKREGRIAITTSLVNLNFVKIELQKELGE